MAFHHQPKIVTNGLALYLDAANPKSYPGDGTTWNDLSPTKNDGVISGPVYNNDSNGVFEFSGGGQYVNLGSESNINPTSISLSAWVNWSSLSGYNTVIERWSTTTTDQTYYLTNYTGTGKLDFYIRTPTGFNNLRSVSNTEVTINNWHYITATYDENTNSMVMYNNAMEVDATVAIAPAGPLQQTTSSMTAIGYDVNRSSSSFNGKIATSKIYNRALSDAEVLQNYNALKSRFGL